MFGSQRNVRLALAVLMVLHVGRVTTAAHTPESPEVQRMVKQAADYLLQHTEFSHGPGEEALVALALFKSGVATDHPRIQQALARAQTVAHNVSQAGMGNSCYGTALCCILMCDLEPSIYHEEISLIISAILRRQRPNGCWSYEPFTYNDTSQTQYCILCLWVAAQNGFEVPVDAIERTAIWLISTQYPEGGWSYRPPKVAGDDQQPVSEAVHVEVTHSMSSAGVGMLYMCNHLFGFGDQSVAAGSGLPLALTLVNDSSQAKGLTLRPETVSRAALQNSLRLADGWFARNLRFDVQFWTHYYMYSYERYKSFQELVERQTSKEPAWYTQGVEFLRRTQQSNGSWKSPSAPTSSAAIDTAFAVLFLTRSSKKTIDKTLLEGELLGGKGLPKDLTDIRLKKGQIVAPEMVENVEDMLKLLEDQNDEDFDPSQLANKLMLDADPTKLPQQLDRLRRLVRHNNYQVRLNAVKALSTVRELDNVPALIYALSDPDTQVSQAALDGLRFTSRRLDTPNLPSQPTKNQLLQFQKQWKEWYSSIRPDGTLWD